MCHDGNRLRLGMRPHLASTFKEDPQECHAFIWPQHRTRGLVVTAVDSQDVIHAPGAHSGNSGLLTYIYIHIYRYMNVRPAGDSSFIFISFTTTIPLFILFFPNIFLLLLLCLRHHASHHLHPKTRSHPFLRSQNTTPASVKPVSATLANTYTHSADCTASPLGPTLVIVRGICTKSVEKMDCPAGQIGLVGVLILDKKGLSP